MANLRRPHFPDPVRDSPHLRAWNIGCRTAHIAATGTLCGGHAFDVAESQLRGAPYLSIATGLALVAIEAYPGLRCICQGRGVAVLSKLVSLFAVQA
jgi:hypothetical protein